MHRNILIVVGTGMRASAHLTPEAADCIARSQRVFYLVSDPLSDARIRELNQHSESLQTLYSDGRSRARTYEQIVRRILRALRDGSDVCAVFYGHPGVFVGPSHEAIRRARKLGYQARMLPAISAEDSLFADLGVDPARNGCQSYEATDFLIRPRRWDTASALVLWQVGCLGDMTYRREARTSRPQLCLLRDALLQRYPRRHRAVVYEASLVPALPFRAERVQLGALADCDITYSSTLYVPPLDRASIDEAMVSKLIRWE